MTTNVKDLHVETTEIDLQLSTGTVTLQYKPINTLDLALILNFLVESVASEIVSVEERAKLRKSELLQRCQEQYTLILNTVDGEVKAADIVALFLNPQANQYLEEVISRAFPQVRVKELSTEAILALSNFLLEVLAASTSKDDNVTKALYIS